MHSKNNYIIYTIYMQVQDICKLRTTRSPLAAYKWISIDDSWARSRRRESRMESIFYSYNAVEILPIPISGDSNSNIRIDTISMYTMHCRRARRKRAIFACLKIGSRSVQFNFQLQKWKDLLWSIGDVFIINK